MTYLPHMVLSFFIVLTLVFDAHAALYQVVVSQADNSSGQTYGVAVAPDSDINCFSNQCIDSDFSLAVEAVYSTQELSFIQEVMLGVDHQFYYLDWDDLNDYCYSDLGYETCDSWTDRAWYGDSDLGIGGLENERNAFYNLIYQANQSSYVDDTKISDVPDSGSRAPSTEDYSYTFVEDSVERVITRIDEQQRTIGVTSSGYYSYDNQYVQLYRQRGYVYQNGEMLLLEPKADDSLGLADADSEQNVVEQMGRTMAFDSFEYDNQSYVVGSASVSPFYYDDDSKDYYDDVTACVGYDEPAFYAACQNFGFANRAFVWNISDTTNANDDINQYAVTDWDTDSSGYHEYDEDLASAQASAKAAAIASSGYYQGLPVLAGYNTTIGDDNDFLMQAAVFRPSSVSDFTVSENAWETTFISNATVEVSDEYIHTYSTATDVNQNLLVIGYAKRDGDYPSDGVTDRRMFIADASDSTPSASFFTSHGEAIFFDSAEGVPHAINNYNEIVGEVDAETHREVEGKIRDHRGYIYPYNGDGSDDTRLARLANQAWWLDDLTHGGDYSSANNHFRIIAARDINDAGVIAATAIQCFADQSATESMEYDSSDHFSYCNQGVGDERVVAVTLLPIAGATSADISAREEDTSTVTRSGAALGLIWLLIGLFATRLRWSVAQVHDI
ncbi:DUF3466 family protein [Vibrio sp. SCSIO 43136]|uniref:DUF3466 family protein n=1 Tax=Vibrio sp. SCSIO 43136 TaxID=2819101 RepID=UPI0020764430|nr:DUF3466 family protein [Vibrio sp. SCSIO 43136]USD67056.1 DUF3466 family protein [Vibrio sp. SCSIO 43136]